MKIETKIKIKILTLAAALAMFAFFYPHLKFRQSEVKGVSFSQKPQVLGVSTLNIRGDAGKNIATASDFELDAKNLENVKAKSYMVFDFATGEVISEKNARERLPIASLTKLMTAWIAYNNLDFRQEVQVNWQDLTDEKPLISVYHGDSVKVGDLFSSMLVGSANDAAQILARVTEEKTGKNFIILMNEEAQALGLLDSSFSNPMGYDSYRNFSTAENLRDLVMLTWKLPAFSNLGRLKSYEFKSEKGIIYKINATNKIFSKYTDLFAIKTGYTAGSMGSMISEFKNEKANLGIIVISSPQREKDTELIRNAILKSSE